jgi:hypothetical protein
MVTALELSATLVDVRDGVMVLVRVVVRVTVGVLLGVRLIVAVREMVRVCVRVCVAVRVRDGLPLRISAVLVKLSITVICVLCKLVAVR